MAGKPSYYELLRHPEWQKKRLKIMEAAGFECADCGDGDTTLNVHHKYYEKGAKPWEYPDDALICLCEPCHERWEAAMTRLRSLFAGFTSCGDIDYLSGVILALRLELELEDVRPDSHQEILAIAEHFRVSCHALEDVFHKNRVITSDDIDRLSGRVVQG